MKYDFGEKKLEVGDIFITDYDTGPYTLKAISDPCNCYSSGEVPAYHNEDKSGEHYHLQIEMDGKDGYGINCVDVYGSSLSDTPSKCQVIGRDSWVDQELF